MGYDVFDLQATVDLHDTVTDRLRQIQAEAQNTDNKLNSLSDKFSKFGEKLTSLGESLTKRLTVPLAAAGVGIIKLADVASNLGEAQNVVENTFKKSSKAIEDWTKTTATSAGISQTASTQWVGFMGAMLKSSGVTEQSAGDMSKKLVQLTGDMSSFYNVGTDEMWEKIRSGISGETEPLKQLGINMSVANLQAYALSTGIKKQYKEMSQAEQTTLRYNYLLGVTKDAQGDFGRTLDSSFANQRRVAKLNLENLATTIGSKFLPTVLEGTKGLNSYAVALNKALSGENQSATLGGFINNIANGISKLTPDKVATLGKLGLGLAAVGPALIGLGKGTQAIMALDKGLTSGIGSISKFAGSAVGKFGEAKNAIGVFTTKLNPLGQLIGSRLTPVTGVFNNLSNGFTGFLGRVGGIIPDFLTNIFARITGVLGTLGGTAITGLSNIIGIAMKLIAPAAVIGLLLIGLGLAQQQLGTQLDLTIANITAKAPTVINNFISGLVSKIPDLMKTGSDLLMKILEAIIASAPALINGAVALITSLVNGVTQNLPRLIPMVLQLIETILIAIVNNLPQIIMAGLNLLVALVQGISNNTDKIVNTITNIIIKLVQVIAQNLPQLIEAGIKILVALIQGLSRAIPQLIASLPQIFSAIWNGLKGMDWGSIGRNIIDGIIQGVKAMASGLANSVKNVASGALSAVKSFLGIHSPSRKFRDEIGQYIPQGIAVGISEHGDVINDQLKQLSDDMKFDTDLNTRINASSNLTLSSNVKPVKASSTITKDRKNDTTRDNTQKDNQQIIHVHLNVDGRELAHVVAENQDVIDRYNSNELGGVFA
jgi:phage-related protein